MQRSWAVLFTAALVLASAVSAMAQPPQRGGGGGRGPGGGGFGGPAFLVAMEAVQKELAVTDAQKEKLTKLREEAVAGFAGGGGGGQNLSDEERAKRRTEMEERAKKTEESLKAILDEKQQARLNELVIQQAGVAALGRPEVAAKLKLTDEQKTKLREQAEANRGQGGGGRGGLGPNASQEDRQKAFEEMRARREKSEADAMAVLTAEQKKAFEDMKGKKFDFPTFGGFGGGRQGGGNRPPRDAN